jgi:hypothetical protein
MKWFVTLLFLLVPATALSQQIIAIPRSPVLTLEVESHYGKESELYIIKQLAEKMGCESEVRLPDESRVDLLSRIHAIEVEWASNWKEAPGQAVLYAIWAERKPAVFLLVKDWKEDKLEILRCKLVCEKLGIDLLIVKIEYVEKKEGPKDGKQPSRGDRQVSGSKVAGQAHSGVGQWRGERVDLLPRVRREEEAGSTQTEEEVPMLQVQ